MRDYAGRRAAPGLVSRLSAPARAQHQDLPQASGQQGTSGPEVCARRGDKDPALIDSPGRLSFVASAASACGAWWLWELWE